MDYLSCHNVHGVFNGIPLFSEFSISFSDRLERCGELPFVSAQSTCDFDGKLCKKALETIGEPLDSSAIFRWSKEPQQITSLAEDVILPGENICFPGGPSSNWNERSVVDSTK